jgi:hypothetical protein
MRARPGLREPEAAAVVGFACVGRWTGAGPFDPADPDGAGGTPVGCDRTLGGLLQLHRLVVVDPDGVEHLRFEVATPGQAQALWTEHRPPLVAPAAGEEEDGYDARLAAEWFAMAGGRREAP